MNAQRGIRGALLGRVSSAAARRNPFNRTSRFARRGLLWTFLVSTLARSDSLTVTIPQGLSTLADPFISGSNLISQVLTNVPEGTQLYKFDAVNQHWLVNQFQFGAWARAERTLAPGEGAFIRNPSDPFSITFTGIPPASFVVSVRSGNNMLSLPTDGTSQLSPRDNDTIRLWDPTQANYSPALIASEGIWLSPFTGLPQDPTLRAGESFLYYRSPAAGETVPQVRPSVYLNNYAPASGLDAPIASTYGCFGSTWVAQLYQGFGEPGPFNNSYTPVGDPVRLFASAGATYVDPQLDAVPVVSGSFLIRVWDGRSGSTFEAVLQRGRGSLGSSKTFTISPGPELQPPVNLAGLEPFVVGPITTFGIFYPNPTNVVVAEGQSAQFSASSTSFLPDGDLFTYQWQKETAPNTWTDIPGATSIILVIPSVQQADAGRYRAVSTFDCASGATLPSVLTVFGQLRIEAGITLVGNQTVILSGFVPTGLSFQLEESYDLSRWTNFAAFTSPPESWSVLVTNVQDFSMRFFRLRSAP